MCWSFWLAASLLTLCGLNPKPRKNNYLHLWNNPLRSEAQTGNRLLPAQMPRERHTLRRHACVCEHRKLALLQKLLSFRPTQHFKTLRSFPNSAKKKKKRSPNVSNMLMYYWNQNWVLRRYFRNMLTQNYWNQIWISNHYFSYMLT